MNQPAEAPLVCVTCRQRFQHGPAVGSMDVSSERGPSAASTASELPEEVAPIGRLERRSAYSVYLSDPVLAEEFEELGRVECANRRPGANLRVEAIVAAGHPEMRAWLEKSDRIADPKVTKGRADLVKHRRGGILRLLEGEDGGFPVHQPLVHHRLPQGQGFWLLRLRDELEWLVMPVLKKTISRPYPRPTKDRLNHREARAILDWKASRLDMWLADRPHLVGGRLAVDSSRGVLFDTDAFVRWVYALMN